jgi:hypothetical protein
MKASLTNRTILELLAFVMVSGLLLWAAFSMFVQMDAEMNALEGRNVVAFLEELY